MHTELTTEFATTTDGQAAAAILRKCVHCGFCTATCPTYQLLGDELDGPRGRIYLMKRALEGAEVTRSTQLHLDRCLTCRACETTCPSGVDYGHLVDIGRDLVDARVTRPFGERLLRAALRAGLTSPLFGAALRLGQSLRPLLPPVLRDRIPVRAPARNAPWPRRGHRRRVLLLAGCVQPALRPNINAATARVLDAGGIETRIVEGAGCCGAIRTHLGDRPGGLDDMRRNIDAWWPLVADAASATPVEAIVTNASGCGATIKEYGHALASDPAYAERAARISALARDVSELLPSLLPLLKPRLAGARDAGPMAYQAPCTLQHGQRLRSVESDLRALGFDVRVASRDHHLCCGSAGSYSILQPSIARELRARKLGALAELGAGTILSANIGCIQHLQGASAIPVRHWIEVLDATLAADAPGT